MDLPVQRMEFSKELKTLKTIMKSCLAQSEDKVPES